MLFLAVRSQIEGAHGEFGSPTRRVYTRHSPKADALVSFGFRAAWWLCVWKKKGEPHLTRLGLYLPLYLANALIHGAFAALREANHPKLKGAPP